MLLQLHVSFVLFLSPCTAAQQELVRRRRAASGSASADWPARDAWLKDLLKYDFESRIWDMGVTSNSAESDIGSTYNVDDRNIGIAKKHSKSSQNTTSNEMFTKKVGSHDLLALEYAKKVNDYYANTQWEYSSAEGIKLSSAKKGHGLRPIVGFSHEVDPVQDTHKINHSSKADVKDKFYDPNQQYTHYYDQAVHDNWQLPNLVQQSWYPYKDSAYKKDSYITQSKGSGKPPKHDTHLNQHGGQSKHILGLQNEHLSQQKLDRKPHNTRRNQHESQLEQHDSFTSQNNTYENQHETYAGQNTAEIHQHNALYPPKHSQSRNDISNMKQNYAPHLRQNHGLLQKKNDGAHRKQNAVPTLEAQSANLVVHYHHNQKNKLYKHKKHMSPYRRRPSHHRRRPSHKPAGGVLSRSLKPLLVVGGVLLAVTLGALGYLIWLTPPTIVTYSKRQRSSAGADLLAAPFELRQLTELLAQLSQALAEAELVALQVQAGGDSSQHVDRWRRCHPLQVCRALLEGAVIRQQPVWTRYIRAAPWLWMFGLDSSTAVRLQELAQQPGFRSCRPYFRPCGKS